MRTPDNVITFQNKKEIHLTPHLSFNDSFAMRECAKRGMGIVNLHDYMVTSAIQEGSLVEILKEYQEPEIQVYLYYQKSRYLQPKIRKFIDFYT